jgi:flagellum-specific peptidoglycan hydrolase FlgJ
MLLFIKLIQPKPGRISYIFGTVLVVLVLIALMLPEYQVQAEIKPTTTATVSATSLNQATLTPSPTVSPTVTPVTATVTPTVTITPTAVVSTTPGVSTATPTPSPAPNPSATVITPTAGTATPADEAASQQAKAEQEKKEKEKQEALAKARNYILSAGEPDAATIDNWLARCNSPQLLEAAPGKTIGQTYLELGWKYGINPAYAVAFFTKESTCGTAGSNLAAHNFGNIRWTPGYPTLDGVWRAYSSWTEGMEDWFKLLRDNYLGRGARSLADVLPVYAPESENDTTLYMNQVMGWVDALMAASPDRNINLKASWYCEATGFQIGWDFLDYWNNHGGVTTLGWPIGNQQYEDNRIVQYFERGVMEYHPENQPPYQILLRNLGQSAGKSQPPVAEKSTLAVPGSIYFSETGHWLDGRFAQAWKEWGGLAQFGYPIAEPEVQGTYLIQWFERARFELDLSAAKAPITLGLLGREALTPKLPDNVERNNSTKFYKGDNQRY